MRNVGLFGSSLEGRLHLGLGLVPLCLIKRQRLAVIGVIACIFRCEMDGPGEKRQSCLLFLVHEKAESALEILGRLFDLQTVIANSSGGLVLFALGQLFSHAVIINVTRLGHFQSLVCLGELGKGILDTLEGFAAVGVKAIGVEHLCQPKIRPF